MPSLAFRKTLPEKCVPPERVLSLGDAWAGSSVNCVPFRRHGVLTRGRDRWCTFYDSAGDVVVQHWNLADGSAGCERRVIPCPRPPHDAHNAISLGTDGGQNLWLAYGAHASTMFFAQFRGDQLDETFRTLADMDPRYGEELTYPMFVEIGPRRETCLLYRVGRHNAGAIAVARWNEAEGVFTPDPMPVIEGRLSPQASAGPYLNDPAIGTDGSLGLFLVWRVKLNDPDDRVVNRGVDFVTSHDGLRTLSAAGGLPLPLPVTPLTSPPAVAAPLGGNLINQASACVNSAGDPFALTYWNDALGVPQYQLIRRASAGWTSRAVSQFQTRFDLMGKGTLPLPHSRPVVLASRKGHILCLFRSVEFDNRLTLIKLHPPHYNRLKMYTLIDKDLGFYEPVIDRGAWAERGDIILYVQWCKQSLGDGDSGVSAAEASLTMWSSKYLQKEIRI